MKVYAAAFEIQKSTVLSGKCWIDEVYKPINSLIAKLKHFLFGHGGIRTEYLGLYAA